MPKDILVSNDMLPELRILYGDWIQKEIQSVKMVQKNGKVFLETVLHKERGDLEDEVITLTDLSFISDDIEGQQLFFSPDKTAEENTKRFLDEFDPISIINCTELLKLECYKEIASVFDPRLKKTAN